MKNTTFNAHKTLAAVIAGVALSILYCCPLTARQATFTVKQDGSGDFSSISEAVAAVPSDSTLVIYEGVYNEHIDITDKTINLEGRSKDECIIQYNGSNYFEPPLSVAAGTIRNLTFYSYEDKYDNWVTRHPAYSDPEIPASCYKEYTVHIEQDYLAGKELLFENCVFISDKNHCIGLGLRKDACVSFINCEFRAYGLGGIIYAHDSFFTDYAGECALRLIDCKMYNYMEPCFFNTQCLHLSSRINLTFQNVLVHTVGYSGSGTYPNPNSYIGRTIGELIELDCEELLEENGYSRNDLVFCLNETESRDYMAKVMSCVSSIDNKIFLPEGITRVLNGQTPSATDTGVPIYVDNVDIESPDGWCGCANFYLTPDSRGNTFAEMNYQEP